MIHIAGLETQVASRLPIFITSKFERGVNIDGLVMPLRASCILPSTTDCRNVEKGWAIQPACRTMNLPMNVQTFTCQFSNLGCLRRGKSVS